MEFNVVTHEHSYDSSTGHFTRHVRHSRDSSEIKTLIDAIVDRSYKLCHKTGKFRNCSVVVNNLDFLFIKAYQEHYENVKFNQSVIINTFAGVINIIAGETKFPAFIDGIYEKK